MRSHHQRTASACKQMRPPTRPLHLAVSEQAGQTRRRARIPPPSRVRYPCARTDRERGRVGVPQAGSGPFDGRTSLPGRTRFSHAQRGAGRRITQAHDYDSSQAPSLELAFQAAPLGQSQVRLGVYCQRPGDFMGETLFPLPLQPTARASPVGPREPDPTAPHSPGRLLAISHLDVWRDRVGTREESHGPRGENDARAKVAFNWAGLGRGARSGRRPTIAQRGQ